MVPIILTPIPVLMVPLNRNPFKLNILSDLEGVLRSFTVPLCLRTSFKFNNHRNRMYLSIPPDNPTATKFYLVQQFKRYDFYANFGF